MLKKTTVVATVLFMATFLQGKPEFICREVNSLYLKKMPKKLWWNKDYKYRIPILVSETIGKRRAKTVIDFECDFKRKVNPKSIRVVTPWEEELPSQVIPVSSTKIEILFQTPLRKYQNKPFFIYFGSRVAEPTNYDSGLSMKQKDAELVISNEKIQVRFGTDNQRSAKTNSLRITGSNTSNQLTERFTGVTWSGFDLGKYKFKQKPTIKENGIFKKTIEYESKKLSIEYFVYSFSPRIDFKITSHGVKEVKTETKWLPGGGCRDDTLYYEGKNGPLPYRGGALDKMMREGWAALHDRKVNETVGTFWDMKQLKHFRYYWSSINGGEAFNINFALNKPVTGSLVALNGGWKVFRNNYIDWKNPPVVTLGEIQKESNNIQPVVPDYTKDFTCGFKFSAYRDGFRATDDYAEHLVENIRALGGNSAKFNIYRIESIPLTKEQYEKYQDVYYRYYAGNWKRDHFPEYKKSQLTDSYLQGLTKAAHRKGVAVRTWNRFTPFAHFKKMFYDDPEAVDIVFDIYDAMAGAGVDLLQSYCAEEWEWMHGKGVDNPAKWFAVDKKHVDFLRKLRKRMKNKYPDLPINTLCSTDGWLSKLQFMDEKAPYLDTVENEFCPGLIPNMASLKYGIKRMQGIFGNDGRSIQHHFYFLNGSALYRISEMECPMIFGIKSFCQESLLTAYNNPDWNEITAGFYRLTNYTSLDEFMAGCTPYKFMAVLRDGNEVKNDIREKRLAMFPGKYSLHEARCKQIVSLKNIPVDVIFNRFFTTDVFKNYKLLFIPSDRAFSNKCVTAISAYLKGGGCVIAEGRVVDNENFAKLAGVVKTENTKRRSVINSIPMTASIKVKSIGAKIFLSDEKKRPALFIHDVGRGSIVYSPYILSDDINNSTKKAVWLHNIITRLAGKGPIITPEKLLTAMDSSLLRNGNDYFFGVYNPAYEASLKADIALDIANDRKRFILNVKTGEKTLFKGKVGVDIAPLQTGFYIIGSDKTTAIPKSITATTLGNCCANTGMTFIEKPSTDFKFSFTKPGKPKVVGILKIHNKNGAQSQTYGAKAIYDCLRKEFKTIKIKTLENLQDKTIDGCDAVIVPNMGTGRPNQLREDWWSRLANFARQGGGVMLIHHAIGIGDVGEPAFPSIGRWSGDYYPVNKFKVVNQHPVTKGLGIGAVFTDECWDYDQIKVGRNGIVLAEGQRKKGIPTPALVVGKYGKGNVIVSGIGIGCGYNSKTKKKYEAIPQEGLKTIVINSVCWMLKNEKNSNPN